MSASWEPFRAAPWLGPRLRPQKHSQFHVASKWMDYGLRSAVFILLFQLLRLAFLFSFLGCCFFFFLLVVSCFVFCCFFNSPYTRLIAVHSICITHKTALGLPVWAAELQNTKILPRFFFSQRPSLHLWAARSQLFIVALEAVRQAWPPGVPFTSPQNARSSSKASPQHLQVAWLT